ncbi:Long chain acyl-coA synthetase, related [Eimeria maxima]|uniref:Long chain acyl-coA synthetase, related n=1 Tax=Eimeria maxima TaxID=5804 RepID=U6MD00_EIMMA|nr:Long chain acyl-coA synthetase, related [Eimeria maxima]CDJ60953.1 Long chain acyl-coA synthetase, related [Eimeria maxima]
MLSNENVLASLDTLTDWRARALFIMEGDRMLCIDSLASIHQRVLHLAVVEAGATVAFARSGLLTLGKDLETLQPTIIAASGGILPMLHAAAKRTLKSMGRLRRFWVLLKLRLRARRFPVLVWCTCYIYLSASRHFNVFRVPVFGQPDFQLAGALVGWFCSLFPFEELKAQLAPVHTIIAAPALVSSELIKELQLLYSVVIVHACCSAETGIAFSSREQNNSLSGSNDSSSASGVGTPSEFGRVRAAPLGWPSPVVVVDLEELSAADKANAIDYHGEEVPGKRSGGSPLVLKTSKDHTHQQIVSISRRRRRSRLNGRKKHSVTEGEIAIQGPCVSVGYYRHQTAFQRQLTPRGLYKTGLVGISTGDGFPFLLTSSLSRSVLTAEGEFIDLEEAERQIRKVHIVKRVLLYVDDFHSPLVAIVQPRKGAVFRWAKTRFAFADEYGASYEELVSLPALRKFVLHAIQEETSLSLEHFELPKAVYLVPHDVELPVAVFDQGKNGPNKSSHLMSRRQLAEAYAQPIQEMYWQLNE